MGSVRDRAGCERLRETNAIFRQRVQSRSLNALVTVAMDMIGTKRVDRNQIDIRSGWRLLWWLRVNHRDGETTSNKYFRRPHGNSDSHNHLSSPAAPPPSLGYNFCTPSTPLL